MEPAELQEKLAKHFSDLRERRAAAASSTPIFALEHGLSPDELGFISRFIRHNRAASLDRRLGLLWVVYATEIGYGYSGDEYWQTFEEQTPGWVTGDRYRIKNRFIDFHKNYGGYKPIGPWAQNFPIICWPISHALLPRDLQRRMARILFDVRYELTRDLLQDSLRLGELIASHAVYASSRFRQIAEQTLLLGQIATGLLLHEQPNSNPTIHPATLSRVSKDLEKESVARSWMQGARAAVAKQLVGFGRPLAPRPPGATDGNTPRARPFTAPRLVLRPANAEAWDLFLELPDMSAITQRLPSAASVLSSSRCTVNGAGPQPLSGGRLLLGKQLLKLERVPDAGVALLTFERSTPEFDHLLRNDCVLENRQVRIFRVAPDGVAFELQGAVVRPSQDYILVCKTPQQADELSAVRATFTGAYPYRLRMPEVLDLAHERLLKALGIAVSRTVTIWPAGLAASRWDGDGSAEWLTTDAPILGLRADFGVETISIKCGDRQLVVTPAKPGDPSFVDLSPLPIGQHLVELKPMGAGVGLRFDTAQLSITIRVPEPWRAGQSRHGLFFVDLEPPFPSLEDLWDGKVTLEAAGPSHSTAHVSMALFERAGPMPTFKKAFQLSLPISRGDWLLQVHSVLRADRSAQNSYDQADRATVQIQAGEWGRYATELRRELRSLRWAVQRSTDRTTLRLVNEADSGAEVIIDEYSFDSPDVPRRRDTGEFVKGAALSRGGLFVFRTPDSQGGVVVAPVVQTLTDLQLSPRTHQSERSPDGVLKAVQVLETWATARVTGLTYFVSKVITLLRRDVFRLIGGVRWEEAERAIMERPTPQAIDAAIRLLGSRAEMSVGIAIETGAADLAGTPRAAVLELLVGLLDPYCRHLPSNGCRALRPLTECALRLATGTTAFPEAMRPHKADIAAALVATPLISRAARLIAILINAREPNYVWDWQ